MVHVIAVITAQPGMRAQILEAHQANVETVRAEEGCIEYTAVVDMDGASKGFATYGPDSFVVIEKWASFDALKAHGKAPHMQAHSARIKPLLASVAVHVLSEA